MQYYSIAVVFRLILTKSFEVGVSCRILYSCAVYLYVSGSRSITAVGELHGMCKQHSRR